MRFANTQLPTETTHLFWCLPEDAAVPEQDSRNFRAVRSSSLALLESELGDELHLRFFFFVFLAFFGRPVAGALAGAAGSFSLLLLVMRLLQLRGSRGKPAMVCSFQIFSQTLHAM